jgi:hypothetical protein
MIGGMTKCILMNSFLLRPLAWCFGLSSEPKVEISAEEVSQRFVAVIDGIYKKAPNCRILLVEYLTLLGPNIQAHKDVGLNEEQIHHFQEVSATLQRAYKLAADARPTVELIPIAELSNDHGLGSEDPWAEGLDLGVLLARKTPLHPNLEGMRSVADILYERLESM